ncbi:hypothetical protein [Paracoccus sp. SY]|uniref:hypothetical protein n=1 Tax=Paracoccus sp. SY TaxID=1330255 RepID=UPI000CD06BB9|nr:hypothetical protein [Paracoccus sp. SY]
MSKYDELRKAFSAKQDAEREFMRDNEAFAHKLVFGLRDYLDAPKSFSERDGDTTYSRNYVAFYEREQYGDKWKRVDHHLDAIEHLNDGTFSFRFGLALERAEGSYPKHFFVFDAKCKRRGNTVEVVIDDKHRIACHKIDDSWPDIHNAYELIFNRLMEALQKRPGADQGQP